MKKVPLQPSVALMPARQFARLIEPAAGGHAAHLELDLSRDLSIMGGFLLLYINWCGKISYRCIV